MSLDEDRTISEWGAPTYYFGKKNCQELYESELIGPRVGMWALIEPPRNR